MNKQTKLPSIRTFATDQKLSKTTQVKDSGSSAFAIEKSDTEKISLPKPPISKEKTFIPKAPTASKKLPTPPVKKSTPKIPIPPARKMQSKPTANSKNVSLPKPPTAKPATTLEKEFIVAKKQPSKLPTAPVKKINTKPAHFSDKKNVPRVKSAPTKKPTIKTEAEKNSARRFASHGPATIITDTKKDRFRLFPAVTGSIKSWFEESKKAYQESKKPKYSVPETIRRKGVIQKATSLTGAFTVADHSLIHKRIKEREKREQTNLTKPETNSTTTWTANTEAGYPLLQNAENMKVKVVPRKSFLTENQEIVVTDLKQGHKPKEMAKSLIKKVSWGEDEKEEGNVVITPTTIEAKNGGLFAKQSEPEGEVMSKNETETKVADATTNTDDTTSVTETTSWEEAEKMATESYKPEPEDLSPITPPPVTQPDEDTPWGEPSEKISSTPNTEAGSAKDKAKEVINTPIITVPPVAQPSTETPPNEQEVMAPQAPTTPVAPEPDSLVNEQVPEEGVPAKQESVWSWGGQKATVPEPPTPEEEPVTEEPTPTTSTQPTPTEPEQIWVNEPTLDSETSIIPNRQNITEPEEIITTQPEAVEPTTEEGAPQRTRSLRSFLFSTDINVLVFYIFTIIAVIILIVFNVDFGSKIKTKDLPVTPVVEQPYLIDVPLKIVYLPNPSKETVLASITDLKNSQQTEVSQLALSANEEKTILIPPSTILSLLETRIELNFAESITHLYFGYLRNEIPYIAMKVDNNEIAKEGMLAWENNLYNDLALVFKAPPTDGRGATGTKAEFFDAMLSGTELRLQEDTEGNEKIIYSFIDPNTIIITTDSLTLAELIEINN